MKEEKPASPSQGGEAPGPSKSRPVTLYLAVMFLMAFLLLLISFLSQERSHQAILDLNQQVSASQDAAQLQLEKQQLEFEVAALEENLEAAKEEAKEAQEELKEQLTALEDQLKALEWLRQIEAAASGSSQEEARAMIERFQATGLENSLPKTSPVEGQSSPMETYRALYARLF